MYYYPFNIPSLNKMAEIAKITTLAHWELKKNKDEDMIFRPFIPVNLIKQFDEEISKFGPLFYKYSTVFARRAGRIQKIHIDGNLEHGKTYCSLNLPIYGGNGTVMNWYEGNYDLVEYEIAGIDSINRYLDIKWKEEPKKVDSIEINSPYLVRVDKPHSVSAPLDQDKATLCIRFKKNPTFEEAYSYLLEPKQNI